MKSEFKYPYELTERELKQIYTIHKKVYVSKGIGLDSDIWRNNLLNKRYHDVSDKLLQLFYLHDLDRIDAYNILVEPLQIEGELWSKIIEGGSFPASNRDTKLVFLKMYEDLLAWRKNIILFGETGVKYHSIFNLLIKSNFNSHYDVSKLITVMKTFIQSDEFKLYSSEYGVEIKRGTFITPTYHGYIVVNDYRQT
jgi:hypothetical protein